MRIYGFDAAELDVYRRQHTA